MASLARICDRLRIDAKQQFRMTDCRQSVALEPGRDPEWYILARGERLCAVDEAVAGLRLER